MGVDLFFKGGLVQVWCGLTLVSSTFISLCSIEVILYGCGSHFMWCMQFWACTLCIKRTSYKEYGNRMCWKSPFSNFKAMMKWQFHKLASDKMESIYIQIKVGDRRSFERALLIRKETCSDTRQCLSLLYWIYAMVSIHNLGQVR